MKKILCFPLFVVAVLVSHSWAADCSSGSYSKTFCSYVSGCFKLSDEYTDVDGVCYGSENTGSPNCTCSQVLEACEKDGGLYGGSSVPSALNAEPWGRGENCSNLGLTQIGGKQLCGTYCQWADGCHPIGLPDAENPTATTCAELETNCASNSPGAQVFNNSTCSGGTNPIRTDVYSVANLTVLVQAGSLHISSAKDANVSLYSMSGKQVFSQNISAGYETVSLNNQKQGVYFAVVSSGSNKQTVRIVLK